MSTFRSWILILTFLSPWIASQVRSQPLVEKIDLFEAKTGGYNLYRIPGIVVTAKGSALAYCEARKTSGSDWDAIDLVIRRSTDGGKTWSPQRRIASVGGPRNPSAMKVKGVKADERTHNNPVAIVDAKTGAVHLLFCFEYMRSFYCRSDDDGVTFSTPVEITSTFDLFRPEYDLKVLATGPGHGVQLRSGRLVVPVWLSPATGNNAHHPSVASVVYSDDHGKTWKRGDIAFPNQGEWIDPNETSVVELADGRTMLIARNEAKVNRKLVAFSANGATDWSKPTFQEELIEPICMGGVLRWSQGTMSRVLYSCPNNLDPRPGQKAKPGGSRDRKNLSIRVSSDDGKTWPVVKTLEPGNSGYSDLAMLPDGTILCLYERWNIPGRTGYYLTVARVDMDWLTGK